MAKEKDKFEDLDDLLKSQEERLKNAEKIAKSLEKQSEEVGKLSKLERKLLLTQREVADVAAFAVETIRDHKQELLEITRIDKVILKSLSAHETISQAVLNLTKDNASQYGVGTEALKASSTLLRDSVTNLTQTLGLSKELTKEQLSQARLEDQRRQLIRERGKVEESIAKIIYSEEQKRWVDTRAGNMFVSEASIEKLKNERALSLEIEEQLEMAEAQVRQAEKINIISERLPPIIGESIGKLTDMWKFLKVGGLLAVGALALTGLFAGVGLIVGGIIKLFKTAWEQFKLLDEAAVEFRKETGLVGVLSKDVVGYTNVLYSRYRSIGVEIGDIYAGAVAWRDLLSSAVPLTAQTAEFLTLWTNKLGISKEAGAGFVSTMMMAGGASQDVATELASITTELALQSGVGAAEVFETIQASASEINLFMRGNKNLMIASAIESRRMGINLSEVANAAGSLLDFETSIGAEMKASMLIGKQINFGRARQLAFDGDILGMEQESMRVIKQTGDFLEMNKFEKEALADASGLSVDFITKQLMMEKALGSEGSKLYSLYNGLNDEMKQRVDLGSKTLETDLKKLKATQSLVSQAELLKLQWREIFIKLSEPFLGVINAAMPIVQTLLSDFAGWVEELKLTDNLAERIKNFIEGINIVGLVDSTKTFLSDTESALNRILEIVKNILIIPRAMGWLVGKAAEAAGIAVNAFDNIGTGLTQKEKDANSFKVTSSPEIVKLQEYVSQLNEQVDVGNMTLEDRNILLDRFKRDNKIVGRENDSTIYERSDQFDNTPRVEPLPIDSPAVVEQRQEGTLGTSTTNQTQTSARGTTTPQVNNDLVNAFLAAVGNKLVFSVDGKELGRVIMNRQEII